MGTKDVGSILPRVAYPLALLATAVSFSSMDMPFQAVWALTQQLWLDRAVACWCMICFRARINPSLALGCCKKCYPKKLCAVTCMISAILSDETQKTPLWVILCFTLSKNLTYSTKRQYIPWSYSFSCVFEIVNSACISGGVISEAD